MSGFVEPPALGASLDVRTWGAQHLYWSERMRGRALVWPADEDWFINDPLGHAAHAHPDASEIYLVAAGALEVTVGRERHELRTGDLCLIPAGVYHDPLGTLGTDLGLFCVVSPNWRGRRWQTEDFEETAFSRGALRSPAAVPGPLPSDEQLSSECLVLVPGAQETVAPARGDRERVLYVLEGELEVTVEALTGRLGPHQYQHIPSYARHRLRAVGSEPARVVSVWSAQPLPEVYD